MVECVLEVGLAHLIGGRRVEAREEVARELRGDLLDVVGVEALADVLAREERVVEDREAQIDQPERDLRLDEAERARSYSRGE